MPNAGGFTSDNSKRKYNGICCVHTDYVNSNVLPVVQFRNHGLIEAICFCFFSQIDLTIAHFFTNFFTFFSYTEALLCASLASRNATNVTRCVSSGWVQRIPLRHNNGWKFAELHRMFGCNLKWCYLRASFNKNVDAMNLKRQENEKKKETRTYGDEHVIRFEIPPDERTISIARTRTISGFSGPGYGLEKNKRTTEFANYCCFTQQPMLFVLNEKSECADRKKTRLSFERKYRFWSISLWANVILADIFLFWVDGSMEWRFFTRAESDNIVFAPFVFGLV